MFTHSQTLLVALATVVALIMPTAWAADFEDEQYHEFILFDWDTTQIDVLILPAAAPDALSRLAAIELSVEAWRDGINALGPSWLTSTLVIDDYVVGRDIIPPAALADPEIVVVSGEVNPALLLGIGASSDFLFCDSVQPPEGGATVDERWDRVRSAAAVHTHERSAWEVLLFTSCSDSTENVCMALNTNFAVNRNGNHRMYDLNAHEFGHCLGIGHVGDALDFSARRFPATDIMSYQFDPNRVHCVSSLNVKSISGTFAKVAGRPSSEWLDYPDFVAMDPSDYTQVNCPNPDDPLLGDPGVFG